MENLVRLNETDRPTSAWETCFDVGVEAMVGLPGKKELYDTTDAASGDSILQPIVDNIIALHPGITDTMVTLTTVQTYEEVVHLTIKIATGNPATVDGSLDQDVWKNLTSVLTNAETAQVFLAAALNCAEAGAPTPCTPAAWAQQYYEASQVVPVAPPCPDPVPEAGCPTAPAPEYYTDAIPDAGVQALVLKVPDVLSGGTPQPAAGAITGAISMAKPFTFLFDMPVEPVVMCFPDTAGEAAAASDGSIFMLGLLATWAVLGGYLIYKAYKAGG